MSLNFALLILLSLSNAQTKRKKRECRQLPLEGHRFCFSGSWKGRRRYYYNKDTKQCVKFLYYGCGGSENRFESKKECYALCNPRPEKDCRWEKDAGTKCSSRGLRPGARVYYDKTDKSCRRFDFEGCGGNANNFENYLQCQVKCGVVKNVKAKVQNPKCYLPIDKGHKRDCKQGSDLRYGFDANALKCVSFEYHGCGGNANNYRYGSRCEKACGVIKPSKESMEVTAQRERRKICKQRGTRGEYCKDRWSGRARVMSTKTFSWNAGLGQCDMIFYRGCGGKHIKNRFKTAYECSQSCSGIK